MSLVKLLEPIKTNVPITQLATQADPMRATISVRVPILNAEGVDLMTIGLEPAQADDKTFSDDERAALALAAEIILRHQRPIE
jgi:hypothetical protein